MVKNYSLDYDGDELEIFNKYEYKLHSFQKWAISGILNDSNVLVTSHTGMGKTFVAEFAIEHFISLGKRVIYTAPIKTLLNEKYKDFNIKFPNISFGITTGDIPSFNADAQVIIMTTEILRNILLTGQSNKGINLDITKFECFIYDEIHYINDEYRGTVWEECIMLTPKNVINVMLSATIDKPESFAEKIEVITGREVYLTGSSKRLIPLEHYAYITCPNLKNQEARKRCQKKLLEIKNSKTNFNLENYKQIKNIKNELYKEKVQISKSLVINELVKFLFTHSKDNDGFKISETNEINLLPAIYFVFSRKQAEYLAHNINISLFGDGTEDQKFCYIVDKRCREILSSKLPNYQEYLNLPEYLKIKRLLEKGIAYHHSGCIPVFKEMIEILFNEGKIKLLFATETMAVGVNMPSKTVIFDSYSKYDNKGLRLLYPHEQTQIAGRSGRQGKDKRGVVIYMANFASLPGESEYKNLLNGPPQSLRSKFKITYNLLLSKEDEELKKFISMSMLNIEKKGQIEELEEELKKINYEKEFLKTDLKVLEEYSKLQNGNGNQRKKMIKYKNNHKNIDDDLVKYKKNFENEDKKNFIKDQIDGLSIEMSIYAPLSILNDFLKDNRELKISIAKNMNELHPLAFTDFLIKNDFLSSLSTVDIICIFSCFIDLEINDISSIIPMNLNKNLKIALINMENEYNKYINIENGFKIYKGDYLEPKYDFISIMEKWCLAENEIECNLVFGELGNIFIGDFVKGILKINNFATDLNKLALDIGQISLAEKLEEIPSLTCKYIAINQSLYV